MQTFLRGSPGERSWSLLGHDGVRSCSGTLGVSFAMQTILRGIRGGNLKRAILCGGRGANFSALGAKLHRSWSDLGASWGAFGKVRGPLGDLLALLGAFLRGSWGLLGAPGAVPGRPGVVLGASWRILGRSWGGPGASWALLGRPRGDTHAHLQRPEHTCTHMLRTRLSWVSLGLCVCGLVCAPGCVCEPPGLRLPMFQEVCACVASAVLGRSCAPKRGRSLPGGGGNRSPRGTS